MNPSSDSEKYREFVRLLTNHQGVLQSFIISLMPGHPETADVLQEANLTMWEKVGEFELGTNFQAWALTIARFKVMNCLKKSNNGRHLPLDEEVIDRLMEASLEIESAEHDRRIAVLAECMKRLRPQDRELLYARYEDDGTLDDYANRIDRPVASLYVLLGRLRHKLKCCVEAGMKREELLS